MNIEQLIKDEGIFHYYQPLYNLSDWTLYGYEALVRSNKGSPESLFHEAASQSKLIELDILSITKVINSFFSLKDWREPLFINVFPHTVLHRSFIPYLENLIQCTNVPTNRVVLEIIETKTDIVKLKKAVTAIKETGIRIALDDIGNGFSCLQKMIEIEPEFVKLDRYFSNGLSTSDKKQKLITLLNEYCKKSSKLVLEGIEEEVDLAVAKTLGIPIGQGFLLGKPSPIYIDSKSLN